MNSVLIWPFLAIILPIPLFAACVCGSMVARRKLKIHLAKKRYFPDFEFGGIAGWTLLIVVFVLPVLGTLILLPWLFPSGKKFELDATVSLWMTLSGAFLITSPIWLGWTGIEYLRLRKRLWQREFGPVSTGDKTP